MAGAYVEVTADIVKRAGANSRFVFNEMAAGLKRMKAWCDANAPGWRYSGIDCRFLFESPEDAARFRDVFLANC